MFAIAREPIEPQSLHRVVGRHDGGIAVFLGVVRDRSDDGRSVTGLDYEAYDAMAVREFAEIAREARERFGDLRLAIVHRAGELVVGDVAVAVLAATRHREQAFAACRYAIDAVKSRAPIWKKERYADGSALWKANG